MVAVGSNASFLERLEITPVIAARWAQWRKDERGAAVKRSAEEADLAEAADGTDGVSGASASAAQSESRFKGFESRCN
eukprot:7686358-Pyramimonas_sp.AAC.1